MSFGHSSFDEQAKRKSRGTVKRINRIMLDCTIGDSPDQPYGYFDGGCGGGAPEKPTALPLFVKTASDCQLTVPPPLIAYWPVGGRPMCRFRFTSCTTTESCAEVSQPLSDQLRLNDFIHAKEMTKEKIDSHPLSFPECHASGTSGVTDSRAVYRLNDQQTLTLLVGLTRLGCSAFNSSTTSLTCRTSIDAIS